jgi:hypothetical protein
MKIRKVKNTTSVVDFPKGERQLEYDHQFLFREPMKSPLFWPANVRIPLVRLLRAVQSNDAWEFLLKTQLGNEWYIAKIYPIDRVESTLPIVVMDSDSLNVFMALVCFYCIGYKKGVIEYMSDAYSEYQDKLINDRYKDNGNLKNGMGN